MAEKTEKSLLLDAIEGIDAMRSAAQSLAIQNATMQGSINQLLDNHRRAEDDRRQIIQNLEKVNGRIRALESWRDHMTGGMIAVRTLWFTAAGLVGAAITWVLHKLGLTP